MKLEITVQGQRQAAVLEGRGSIGGGDDDLIRLSDAPHKLVELWPEGPIWRVRTRVPGRVNGVSFPAHVGRVFCPGECIELPGAVTVTHLAEGGGMVGTAAVLKDLMSETPETLPSLPVFIGLTGPDSGRRFLMIGQEALLGRGDACQLQVRDGSVSRKHAKLERVGTRFWIEDLDSPNGVFVNSRRISRRAVLADGVVIEVGQTLLRFQAPADIREQEDSGMTPKVAASKPRVTHPSVVAPSTPDTNPETPRAELNLMPAAAEAPPRLELVEAEQADESGAVVPVNEPPAALGVVEKVLVAAGVGLMAVGGVAALLLS